jgi:aspartyl-tRNA(Asn)/glutamyl-tRNA(Gln) amidotransferase subunit A
VKTYNSFAEIKTDLSNNTINCVELTQSYIQKINDKKSLNIFLEVFEQSALAKAKEVDEKLKI